VEGASDSKPLLRQSNDRIRRIINAAHQFGCWDSNDSHIMFPEPRIPSLVALRTVTHVMANSINLDSEPRFRAIKVENVGADWMLTTKYRLFRRPLS
jgi:hypothetical protein